MNFINAMQNETSKNKVLTENGAVAYASSGKALLDFNFKLSTYRHADIQDIMDDFARVYYEDPLLAVKYLFWLGDVREGAGERNAFRSALMWLAEYKPHICRAVLELVPEYNRWDSLLPLLDTQVCEDVCKLLKKQIVEDIIAMENHGNVSLCAKWMPSENASSSKTKRYARTLIAAFGWTATRYRKNLSALRKYLDVVEVKMSAKQWGEINYERVPSKANLIYGGAFMRNDTERRCEYLSSLVNGEVKINAGVLQPHEIVSKYGIWHVGDYDETLEQLWVNLPHVNLHNVLVVRDGSGSMTTRISGNTTCLDVSTALAIYMADHNSGDWKGKFVTFSSSPAVVDLSNCKTLRDKLERTSLEDDCSNTNIYKTMRLVLDTAIQNHISQEDMPELICILSDMEFDPYRFNFKKSLFEIITDEFEAEGYKMPRICFWNINAHGAKVPLQQNDFGLILCSGFSVQIMKMFMSGELDPYKVLLDTLSTDRYAAVERAVAEVL